MPDSSATAAGLGSCFSHLGITSASDAAERDGCVVLTPIPEQRQLTLPVPARLRHVDDPAPRSACGQLRATRPSSSVRLGIVDGMANFFDDLPGLEHDDLDEFDDLEPERPRLSLSLEQQATLSMAVAEHMRSCDGTLRGAQRWARSAGVGWPQLRRELEENGGYCDCEAVFNVFGGDFDQVLDGGGSEPE